MVRTDRDYKQEAKTAAKPGNVKDRMARNRARYAAIKAGKVKKGDGKEVDHKNMNPRDNRPSNLRVVSRSTNRRKQPKHKG